MKHKGDVRDVLFGFPNSGFLYLEIHMYLVSILTTPISHIPAHDPYGKPKLLAKPTCKTCIYFPKLTKHFRVKLRPLSANVELQSDDGVLFSSKKKKPEAPGAFFKNGENGKENGNYYNGL